MHKSNLRRTLLTSENKKEFIQVWQMSDALATEFCEYLKRENEHVHTAECYDAQSGMYGNHFIIGTEDLSGNGYCYSIAKVEEFLGGHKCLDC